MRLVNLLRTAEEKLRGTENDAKSLKGPLEVVDNNCLKLKDNLRGCENELQNVASENGQLRALRDANVYKIDEPTKLLEEAKTQVHHQSNAEMLRKKVNKKAFDRIILEEDSRQDYEDIEEDKNKMDGEDDDDEFMKRVKKIKGYKPLVLEHSKTEYIDFRKCGIDTCTKTGSSCRYIHKIVYFSTNVRR